MYEKIKSQKLYDNELTKHSTSVGVNVGKQVKEIRILPDQWQALFSPSIVVLLGYWRPPSAKQMLIKISAPVKVLTIEKKHVMKQGIP